MQFDAFFLGFVLTPDEFYGGDSFYVNIKFFFLDHFARGAVEDAVMLGFARDKHVGGSFRNADGVVFAAGEAAGKFGVCRPGGSALNDTQVGGLRAAKYLAENIDKIETDDFTVDLPKIPTVSADGSLKNLKAEMPALMSKCMSIKRNYEDIAGLINRIEESVDGFYENISVTDLSETGDFLRFRLTLLSMRELCRTVYAAMEKTGSRGSYMCFKGGEFIPENTEYRKYVTITDKEAVRFVPADAIPTEHAVFEKLLKGE